MSHADFPPFSAAGAPRIAGAVRGLRRILSGAGGRVIVVGNGARAQAYISAAWLTLRSPAAVVHLTHEQETAARASARFVLRRFGTVVAVGENAARTYRKRLPGVRVHKVNNFLGPEELARAAARSRPRPNRKSPVVGVVGRLIPEKGVLELLAELAEVREAWSEIVIAGAPQDRAYAQRVEGRITALGLADVARLVGHVEDLAELFNGIDALVVPSVGNEGQPTVILEALAYGRPCIVRKDLWSSDFEGLPVVPFGSARDLGNALADLPDTTAPPDALAERFGPMQVLEVLEVAAAASGGTERG